MTDPRDPRGMRHGRLGLVAAFAAGKNGMKQAAQLAGAVGARTRKRLGLPPLVVGSKLWRLQEKQRTDGLRETLRAQAAEVLEDLNTLRPAFPLRRGAHGRQEFVDDAPGRSEGPGGRCQRRGGGRPLEEDYRYVVTSDDRRDRSHRLRACRPFLRCWPPQSPQCTAPRLNGGAWPHRASLS